MKPIALTLVLFVVLLSSCISMSQPDRSSVVKQREYHVALEKKTSGHPMAYSHPAYVDENQMREMMQAIKYVGKEGFFDIDGAGPVFNEKEIAQLAGPLASALSECKNSQHVRFVSLNRKKTLLLITTFQQTEGVIFRDTDSRIHFVFSYVNSKVSSDDPISLRAQFSGKDPIKTQNADAKLVPGSPQMKIYVSKSGRSYPKWVTTGADTTVRTEVVAPKPDGAAQASPAVQNAVRPEANMSQDDSVQTEIRKKLVYLKGLLKDGLITQDDYDARKKVLLDKLK